jgi:hypothetical protein
MVGYGKAISDLIFKTISIIAYGCPETEIGLSLETLEARIIGPALVNVLVKG